MLRTILLCLIAALGLSGTALAQPSFEVGRGRYLWHVWESPAYKQAFPSWQEFKAQVAKLNNLANDDAAFRSLTRGQRIVLPTLPGTTDVRRVTELESEVSKLQEKISVMQKDFARERQALNAKAVQDGWGGGNWRNLFFMAILFSFAIIGIAWWQTNELRKRNEKIRQKQVDMETKIQEIQKRRKELEFLELYGSRHLVIVEVPRDIGEVAGSDLNRIYLPKADPIDNEPAVKFPRVGVVKVRNIKHHLSKADDETLRELGIQPVRPRAHAHSV